ncbi:HAMP domain-containing sensor histidine kinase [Myxococcus sp. MISCRS1]|uniref:sensor histidine kinase n=1 Tax=Myxococcus TaxID=32 RepID=UPI001CBD22BA|nr:HAMP domain-containing sensor histidine kinase [Myxococcus sp. MISCRS1]MBZ4397887.1 HAMP domain-containing histidine kinase [Myxococcus sp. AS-1-15]MBZ4407549.1 HAMP domain-containing histidine kinase [Myxococcus sp. XM-1-1-1]MCY0998624.1 HAMP domain-containing sensor histidine kinase [Myxococcus sp. MISCRS1]BDT31383.1 HAMP domain-containing histidine kinase [Myxococcus sp. MH1]
MRLARKFTLALVLLAVAVIAALQVIQVRRELERSALDMQHDHRLLGHTLAGTIGKAWQLAGEREALNLLNQSNNYQEQVHLRWVWLDGGPGTPSLAGFPPRLMATLRQGRDGSMVDPDPAPGLLHSYTPVKIGPRFGAIEITESLGEERQHVFVTVVGTIVATGTITFAFLIVAMAMGRRLVGEPVDQLVQLAERFGHGDLSARVRLPPQRRGDELTTLANAMNRMGEQLEETRSRLSAETAARLSAVEHLRHADRLTTVGKLASGVAHELGTPLNVVMGRAKMISSGEAEGEEVGESARIISQQAQHMTRIIRQLLDFARRRAPHRAPEDVRELVSRSLSLLKPMAAKKSITLVEDIPPGVTVEADGGQVQQVLTNLVMNALQAMNQPGTVRVHAAHSRTTPPQDVGGPEGSYVRVDVEDEGSGIAPDVLAHVFEPFFTTKDVGEGTGLGLSVSYGLVRDHGGWIAVRSELGRGSCFSIYLPSGGDTCQAAS